MLYDAPGDESGSKLWKRDGGTDDNKKFIAKSSVNGKLDAEAENSAVYIGITSKGIAASKCRVFDSTKKSGSSTKPDYSKIPVKRIISDAKFNGMPGMSGYSSSHLGKDNLDWTKYFDASHPNKSLNRLSAQTEDAGKTDKL